MLIITRRERNREIRLILNPAAKEAAIEAKPASNASIVKPVAASAAILDGF
jgi:hypothetical protein